MLTEASRTLRVQGLLFAVVSSSSHPQRFNAGSRGDVDLGLVTMSTLVATDLAGPLFEGQCALDDQGNLTVWEGLRQGSVEDCVASMVYSLVAACMAPSSHGDICIMRAQATVKDVSVE